MNLDGGIHEIPLPGVPGRLWLCGKHAIAPDPIALLENVAADHVVCLVEPFELEDRYPMYVEWLRTTNRATWFPIADLDFRSLDEFEIVLGSILDKVRLGESIVAHCAAGKGRAGTLAVSVCLDLGMSLPDALHHVRTNRPGAGPEVGAQMEVVKQWARMVSDRHA